MLATFPKKSILFFALIFSVLIGSVSISIQHRIEENSRAEIAKSLNTLLNTTQQAVHSWMKVHRAAAMLWANTPEIREAAKSLLALPRTKEALIASPAQARLRNWYKPVQAAKGYQGYFIIAPGDISLASSRDHNIGIENLLSNQQAFLQKVRAGNTAFSLPTKSDVLLPDTDGQLKAGLPTMFVGAPITDEWGKVIATFTFRINPAEDFTAIFKQGRIGNTGETYAFDRQGLMLSNSRFGDELRALGLIDNNEKSILNVHLINPGINLIPKQANDLAEKHHYPPSMASESIASQAGINLDGYRDYRGVPVVGAWLWDDVLGFGITTELDVAEAYQTFRATRYTIITFTLLLILLSIGVVVIYLNNRVRLQTQKGLKESEQRLALANNATGMGMFDWDILHDKAICNEQYFQLFDIEPSEHLLSEDDWLAMVHPEDRQRAKEEVQLTFKEKLPYDTAYRILLADGSLRWLNCKAKVFYNKENLPQRMIGVITDITERKRAEEETYKLLAQNRHLTQRMFQVQEEERRHLARELHDGAGQLLTAMQMYTHLINKECKPCIKKSKANIEAIDDTSLKLHSEIRAIIQQLRPGALDELGLEHALAQQVDGWNHLQPDAHCILNMEGDISNLDDNLEVTIYRVVQECLNNIAKYAEASQVSVALNRECNDDDKQDMVLLTIHDDGKGMDLNQHRKGYGITGMRERVIGVGGEFNIQSAPGKGVQIEVRIPLSK